MHDLTFRLYCFLALFILCIYAFINIVILRKPERKPGKYEIDNKSPGEFNNAAFFLLGVEIYNESRGVIKKEYTVMIRDSFSSYGKQKSCLEKLFGDINY